MSPSIPRLTRWSLQQLIAIVLIVVLTGLLAPAPMAAAVLQTTKQNLSVARKQAWTWFASVVGALGSNASAGSRKRKGVRPAALSRVEREARVAALEVNPGSGVVLESRQPLLFTAIPLDHEGQTIHGLQAHMGVEQ